MRESIHGVSPLDMARDVGRVVVLNGTTSSGKTTLALELQSQLIAAGECWMVFGIDDFLSHLPVEWGGYFDTGPHAHDGIDFKRTGDEITFQAGPVGRALLAAYRESIAALARNGLDVIVDEVVVEDAAWFGWTSALHGIDTLWVRVDCPLAVCESREQERGDRLHGLARSQAPVVHRAAEYDIAVDTSTEPPDALAATIIRALRLRTTNPRTV